MNASAALGLVGLLWVIMGGVVGSIAVMKGKDAFVWFLYGFMIWPAALIHVLMAGDSPELKQAAALRSGAERKCPHCAELIKAEAKVCKHCGRDVEPMAVAPAVEAPESRPCPHCGQINETKRLICRTCRRDIPAWAPPQSATTF